MSELCKKIEKYDVISFDIFDTLINRVVEKSTDVFQLVEKDYQAIYGAEDYIKNFTEKRISAERLARSRKKSEIRIEEIYAILEPDRGKEVTDRYRKLEEKIEIQVCVRNQEIFDVYKKCVKLEKRIIVVSDMYLTKTVIEKILHNNGYTEYDCLYLSSELAFTKSKGNLFEYCLRTEKIMSNKMLHIGDNIRSDVKNARIKGINAYWVKRIANHVIKENQLNTNNDKTLLQSFVKHTTKGNEEPLVQIGYSCFGPLLYSFTEWILKECREHCYDKIYFLSRDGYIMKKAFDSIKEDCKTEDYYMFASRRALQVAAIHFNPEYGTVIGQMFLPRVVSVEWLIKRWGLECKDCEEEIKKATLQQDEKINGESVLTNEKLILLYNLLKNKVIRNSEEEYNAFLSYLKELQFEGNVAIVDIGWYGNMQNSLMANLEHTNVEATVTGYYLGVVPDSKYQEKYKMCGYLFQKNKNEQLFYKFKYLNSLMELFFMAPHGSTKKYILQKGKSSVIFSEFEYENTYTKAIVDIVQESAFKFINGYHRTTSKYVKNDPLIYLDNLYSTLMRPSAQIAAAIGELAIWDGKWIKIAPARYIFACIINPKTVIREFLNTPWKMGYLKRMIRLPLPYDSIVFWLRNVTHK